MMKEGRSLNSMSPDHLFHSVITFREKKGLSPCFYSTIIYWGEGGGGDKFTLLVIIIQCCITLQRKYIQKVSRSHYRA